MLCGERKRCERSRKHMLLMLVDHGKECGEPDACSTLSEVAYALNSGIRETDVAGWFDTKCVLGVIFTEFGDSDVAQAIKVIEAKMITVLQQALNKKQLGKLHVSFYAFPDNWSQTGTPINSVLYPDLAEVQERKRFSLAAKRCIDVLGSLAALLVLLPVFMIVALVIKLTSHGPVIFRQERVGQYGVSFIFLKFRSMRLSNDETIHKEYTRSFITGKVREEASSDGKKNFKLTNDPRITWIGKLIRRTSLDELPQFWNVLRGDMSLVGPRPPIPYELQAYDVWHRRRLLEAKPGITGLWQVQGRSKMTFDEMVRLDLQYSRSWTPMMDVKILLQTPRAVVSGDGAY
jgi:lipopolysaccharide/colanic/teichoic acid biosynthesis glycosyltransferase